MSYERELVTLAFGNYASLVAAQWANGTTVYDVSKTTLYHERSVDSVRGGESAQQRTGAMVRVPRIVLLDAPHATRLKSTQCSAQTDNYTNEKKEEDDDNDNESSSEGGVDSRFEIDNKMKGSNLGFFEFSGCKHDENNISGEQNNAENRCSTCDENNDNNLEYSGNYVMSTKNTSKSLKQIKRELFCEKDEFVPWWQYIGSGVSSDSLHMLHPLHTLGNTIGDVPLLHSFGFGLSQLRSSNSCDIAGMVESLRRQLEDADHLQGVQCFVDGDSAFAGAACNVMGEFWEDAGAKIPAVFFTSFQPLPAEVMEQASAIDFADRRKDEAALNRLLATSHMTRHDSSVYVPLELALWHRYFVQNLAEGGLQPAEWLQNDTATAQLVATVADTALYGLRDDGCVKGSSASRPAFYMHDWLATVRPTRSLRLAAALVALPLRVHDVSQPRNDLWDFLQRYPLLQTCGADGGFSGLFAPLTHPISFGVETEAGRVLGHAVTLRGAGRLFDLTYPRQEALLRYGLPLRTSNYIPLVTENSYPISSTFPHDFVLPHDLLASGALKEIDVGSHIVSTYGSAPMLHEIATDAQKVLCRRKHLYADTYDIDCDEWKEVMEDVLQIRDDYDHREIETD